MMELFGISLPEITFEEPLYLLAIIPIFIILLFVIRKRFVSLAKLDASQKKSIARTRFWMLLSRTLIFSLLVVAAAQPFALQNIQTSGDPTITVLRDRTLSMDAVDTQLVPRLIQELNDEVPVIEKSISSGTESKIGDSILSSIREDANLLLVSDGRVTSGRSLGDMMVVAASLNATIHTLELETVAEDAAVVIRGPSVTTTAEESTYDILVRQVGRSQPFRLIVTVNGNRIVEEDNPGSTTTITQRFAEGIHQIEARLEIDDQYSENNVYYKTVKVEPRPPVLLVTKKNTPWQSILQSVYQTTTSSSLGGQDLDKYSAVVLNDIPEQEIDARALSEYVIDGNGLVVVGGRSSYDRGGYKDSLLEGLLPVQVGKGLEEQKTDVNIALLIDISGSTGGGFSETSENTVEAVEKALALSILDDLREDDLITVVAFNTEAFVVSELQPVGDVREFLRDRIPRLTFSGGTRIDEGMKATRRILAPLQGSKNIILLSDGKSGTYSQDIYDTRIASQNAIKVYTVGVGEGTDREHLRNIADAGNGFYFEPSEAERLSILFGEAAAAEDSGFPLQVFNSHHFISHGMTLNGNVNGFNQVVPKNHAELLISTGGNNPLVTVSRLGLGRIAAYTTDDGNGWAPDTLKPENSKMITKTINWAIGDLSRKKDYDVHVTDVHLGQKTRVNVVSDLPPESELTFSKIGDRLYTAEFEAEETGFHDVLSGVGAVNYQLEYRDLGQSNELSSVISVTGGKRFTADQSTEIIEQVKEDAKRVVHEPVTYSWYALAAALAIFLLEVILRRIQEAKRNRA